MSHSLSLYISLSILSLLFHPSQSQLVTVCPFGNSPVCGQDYQTYQNECALMNAGISLLSYGACNQTMDLTGQLVAACPTDYLPVCGTNAVTYANVCRMEAADVPFAHEGPCSTSHVLGSSDFSATCLPLPLASHVILIFVPHPC